MKDRDVIFHKKWLGLAQPIEGLVFSVPVLADAQIAPEVSIALSTAFDVQLVRSEPDVPPRIRSLATFFHTFLGFDQPGMLVARSELPAELAFYAAEGGQELRPSFALGSGPFAAASDDPFAVFDVQRQAPSPAVSAGGKPVPRWAALLWDLTESAPDVDLDAPETVTGPWRYPPTAKLERILRHTGVPVGFLFNGTSLRLVYAPAEETTAHLTFRVEHMVRPDGRPILAALDLLLHARRAYTASPEHTLLGLLAESRRRQADVTDELAKQVFEAVEILVAGFEGAAARDCVGGLDWLRPALEAEADHFYQGVLSIVLRLVFLLYAEDQALLPVDHPTYAEHMSLFGLHERLAHDVGAHPESMHHRFGAYGRLLGLFRAVFFGVRHGTLELPPRHGRLFDPNAFPFLEGGEPGWTAAVVDPAARAAVIPPSIDDGTIYRVLHRLVVFKGQRLSYRTLDVEQIGSVYESLMGFHVQRLTSPAVRVGKFNVWVPAADLRAMSATDRARYFKETCGLNAGPIASLEKALKEAKDEAAVADVLADHAVGKKAELPRHQASAGRLVLQPGEERRRTASHYTPRSLTEKVVRRTLEPLLACLGENRTTEQILELKICDPAMGSGAFLVATCRELASEIVAAWTRQGEHAAIVEKYGDAHLHARRLVAQRCLYGVDKNAAAVELAKLSLWLVTLSKTLPFTFVDHALRHGDSLVGLDFRQIGAFHWSPKKQEEFCAGLLRDALDQAVDLRQQILALANYEDPVSQGEKRRLFEFSQQAIERIRLVADVCVGAFFAETKDAAREKERNRRLDIVDRWLRFERQAADEGRSDEQRATDARAAMDAGVELAELGSRARRELSPFHWWIEFPEVFSGRRGDPLERGKVNRAASFEGVVGNPPFGGKNNIIDSNGATYVVWLTTVVADAHGNSDLCAHFLRRSSSLVGANGAVGLIATKTIAQGDTRVSGLGNLLNHEWILYDATRMLKWPGSANVTVSVIHCANGCVREHAALAPALDGVRVDVVNSRLRPKPERSDSHLLYANDGLSFVGARVGGIGFVLSAEERDAVVECEPAAADLIAPYLGGEEINTAPGLVFHRYAINFGRRTLVEAERWPLTLERIRKLVKPERDAVIDNTGKGGHGKKYWWQYVDRCDPLQEAIAPLQRCLVVALVTKHLAFAWQPPGRVLANTLGVFALDSEGAFATLQSRVHEAWVRLLSSSLEDRLRYAASDCFANFPFPQPDPRTVLPPLESVGQALYAARARFMLETDQGLTKTYNAIKDPACDDARILELRRMHEAMDRAVLDAYGWSNVAVPPYCPASDADRPAVQAFEDEVIDRLYLLNAERAREEERLGMAAKKGKRAGPAEEGAPGRSRGKKAKSAGTAGDAAPDPGQGKLF